MAKRVASDQQSRLETSTMTNENQYSAPTELGLSRLRAELLQHLSDGKFTDQELQVARAQRDLLGLSAEAVRTLRADIFHSAYMEAYKDGNISPAQADTLNRLMQFFNDPRAE
jgi:hypothetical protein